MAARLIALGAPVDNVILHPIPIGIERFPFRPASPPRTGEPIIFLRLRILADETGVGHRITFMPPQSHDEYARTMRMAHIFVHPSRTARNGDGEGGAPNRLAGAPDLYDSVRR